jgi:dGTPase
MPLSMIRAMSIREEFENRERNFMSPYGCLSAESRGRGRPEPPCPVRTAFQLDRDRIVYSYAFRRLKHKTQVFLSPMGDEYRTRLTHTLEVAQMARNMARAMFLNEDLAEAIALGHDLGHTPFGHSGETALKEIFSAGFSHNEQSLRVVDLLENNGRGLNLTYEVRDGILKHAKGHGKIIPDNTEEMACTFEGQIVRMADIMAYLNHDLDDAVRSGVIRPEQVPESCTRIMGRTHSERAATLMRDVIFSTRVTGGELRLRMSDEVYAATIELRQFLYDNVYRSPQVHNEFVKAKKILSELYAFFLGNEKRLQLELAALKMSDCQGAPGCEPLSTERLVCDLISSMTDRYAMNLYQRLFFPTPTV